MALKRGIAAALALSCALLLTGCSSLLESPYAVVEPHTDVIFAINLRISGQSCLYLQAIIELRKFLLILLHDCLTFRTWTYQRHISFEHIE